MKLKHLLALAAMAVGSCNAWAQDLQAGTYYLRNVESGKYVAWGANWGTRSVLTEHGIDLTVTLNNGAYTLITGANGATKALRPSDGYADQSGTWTITPVGDGTYTIMGSAGYYRYDGTALPAVNGSSSDSGIYWEFLSKEALTTKMEEATIDAPVDATHFITAPDFLGKDIRITNGAWKGFSNTAFAANSQPKYNGPVGSGNTLINNTNCEAWNSSPVDINQTLTGLPKGTYRLAVMGFYRAGGPADAATAHSNGTEALHAIIYAGNEETPLQSICTAAGKLGIGTSTSLGAIPNSNEQAAQFFAAGYYQDNYVYFYSDGNSDVQIGMKKNAKIDNDWAIIDNFDLKYYGDVTVAEVILADYVKAYNEAMTTATALLDEDMADEAKTALNNAITSNTVTISSTTKEELETATANLNDAIAAAQVAIDKKVWENRRDELIAQGAGTDITEILVNAAFEAGTLTGWTSIDGGAIATNTNYNTSKFVERWKNGAALGNGSLTHDAINLPAGLYTIKIDAQNIEQYNKDAAGTGLFLRAAGEQVEIGARGIYSMLVKLNEAQDVSIAIVQDNCTGNWICYDNIQIIYEGEDLPALIAATGKMNAEIASAQTTAIAAFDADKTIANYNAALAAIDAAQASANLYASNKTALDAQKALMDATNVYDADGFAAYKTAYEAALATYENETATEVVVNPNSATGWHASTAYNFLLTPWKLGESACNEFANALYINTWSTEGDTDGSNFTVPFFEYWVADGQNLAANAISTTLDVVENGLYKVEAQVRASHNSAEFKAVNLTVNDGDAVNVADGVQIGTTNRYMNTFQAEGLVKDGKLVITFDVPAESSISWFCFKNVKYTKVRDLTPEEQIVYATAEEIAEFNEAIEAAEAKTLGFDEDEYAPYNNVAALAALKAAKALDVENPIDIEVLTEAKNALDNATWTANTEEVNAVYDGTFASATNDGAPAGWRMSNNTLGGALHSRAFVGDDRLAEFNSTNSGLFLRFDGTNSNRGSMYYYGDTEGYTMPLKASTTYYVSVDFAGWGSTGKPLRLNVTGPEGFTAEGNTITTSVKADTETKDPQNNTIVFTTGPAGNYVINFQTPGADSNTHNVVVSNIELKKAEATLNLIAQSESGTYYATFSSDKAVEFENPVVYTVVAEGENLTLALVESNKVPANTGVLIKTENETETYSVAASASALSNNMLKAASVKMEAGYSFYKLAYDNYTEKTGLGFYYGKENGAAFTCKAGTAYLAVPASSSVKSFVFDEDATAINSVSISGLDASAPVYNTAGQRVSANTKGIVIQNGKKYFNK